MLDRYLAAGYRFVAERWRGLLGEIDLIFSFGEALVFVEVKSSSTHARAAQLLSDRQKKRLMQSAEAALAYFPRQSLTPVRIDVALVDQGGEMHIVENALIDW